MHETGAMQEIDRLQQTSSNRLDPQISHQRLHAEKVVDGGRATLGDNVERVFELERIYNVRYGRVSQRQ